MAERKVLSKYFPPDFDPNSVPKSAKRARKNEKAPRLADSRLMTPFSMKCTHCGEFIPKGRKFNARKETLDDSYLSIPIFRFYIRCSRCSGEITFRTDPKNNDYECERGAKRNFEPWRNKNDEQYKAETEAQTLDRLEKKYGEQEEQMERDKMAELEEKMLDSKHEMKVADALDEIRTRNARIERKEARADGSALATVQQDLDQEALRAAREEEEQRKADRALFWEAKARHRRAEIEAEMAKPRPPPAFNPDDWKPKKRVPRPKKTFTFGGYQLIPKRKASQELEAEPKAEPKAEPEAEANAEQTKEQ
ncbi:CWC16 protein [Penicillium griseofulvum]|uniref:Splicing factor YJU2 n=1 Tax=Penicillium patulum TaxID=5078 RepID=A0A135LQZ2_PENPA|nr:CWC16 protein [Penicillium griseofulvum]KXG51398.1 CWC16 protein [Penicillium griseofulvum]